MARSIQRASFPHAETADTHRTCSAGDRPRVDMSSESNTEIRRPCSCSRHVDPVNVDDAYKVCHFRLVNIVLRIPGLDLAPINPSRSRCCPDACRAPHRQSHAPRCMYNYGRPGVLPPGPIACRTASTWPRAPCISLLLPVSRTAAVSERQARKRPGPPPSPFAGRSLCRCRCISGSEAIAPSAPPLIIATVSVGNA